MSARAARLAAAVALATIIASATIVARLPGARGWAGRMSGVAAGLPVPHWAAFSALQVGVAAFGFLPASLMAVAAGAAYGLAMGILVSALSTMLGGWIAFRLARSVLRPWIAQIIARYPASRRFDAVVATEGWRFVLLMRISPVMPFAATSYGLGLTGIGQRAYLLGTLASLPALVGYVALGALGRAGFASGGGWIGVPQWMLPALGVVTLLVAAARLRAAMRAPGTRSLPPVR